MKHQDLSFDMQTGRFTFRVGALIIHINKLLMIKNINFPGYYTIGGNVKFNETTEQAIVREVFEETSMELEIERLAFVHEYFINKDHKTDHQIVFFYLMKEKDNLNLIPENDYETLHWIPLDELKNTHTYPNFLSAKLNEKLNLIQHIVSTH